MFNVFYRCETTIFISSLTETDSGISREASPDDVQSSTTTPQHFNTNERQRERSIDVTSGVQRRMTPMSKKRLAPQATPTTANVSVLSTNADATKTLVVDANESMSSNGLSSHNFGFVSNGKFPCQATLKDRLDHAATAPSPVSLGESNGTGSPDGTANSGEFDSFSVVLAKDPHYGLGLTLVDGEIDKMEGVYIRSITPGGPAQLEGQLRVGKCDDDFSCTHMLYYETSRFKPIGSCRSMVSVWREKVVTTRLISCAKVVAM